MLLCAEDRTTQTYPLRPGHANKVSLQAARHLESCMDLVPHPVANPSKDSSRISGFQGRCNMKDILLYLLVLCASLAHADSFSVQARCASPPPNSFFDCLGVNVSGPSGLTGIGLEGTGLGLLGGPMGFGMFDVCPPPIFPQGLCLPNNIELLGISGVANPFLNPSGKRNCIGELHRKCGKCSARLSRFRSQVPSAGRLPRLIVAHREDHASAEN